MGAGAHGNWREVINPPGAEVTGSSELPDGCWELYLVLYEQASALTAKPALYSLYSSFNFF